MKTKHRQKNKRATRIQSLNPEHRLPFVEHLYELRTRLLYVVGCVLIVSVLAYFIQEQLVDFLLRPAHNQQFIYTSPGGGIGFLFEVCTYTGIIVSVPVIIYNVLEFLAPIIHKNAKRFILRCCFISGLLGIIGFIFGYYLGLPLALHFLGNQFTTKQIHPLFTIQEYMSFVTIYLVGSVLLFQIPLVVLLINRLKPQPPKRFFKLERYVIVASFVIAMVMAPTTNILNQLVIAIPIILLYQLGIIFVLIQNQRKRRPKKVVELLKQDRAIQAERLQRRMKAQVVHEQPPPQQVPETPSFSQPSPSRFSMNRRGQPNIGYM